MILTLIYYASILIPPICLCILYKRIGIGAWEGLVPFYGDFVRFSLASKPKLFIVNTVFLIAMRLLYVVISSMYMLFLIDIERQIQARNSIFVFLGVFFVCYLGYALSNYRANQAFVNMLGCDEDEAVGISFLPFVFLPVLVYKTTKNKTHTKGSKASNKRKSNNSSRFSRMRY